METTFTKAQRIRLAVFDVDGVLTNGRLTYGEGGVEYKTFHAHDSLGLQLLQKTGVAVGIIATHPSDIITRRMSELGITHVYQGYADKITAYEELKQKLNLKDDQISYTGDDLTDLPLILRAGLGITVANARQIVQEHANWITKNKGGNGAVREICETIMQAQSTYDAAISPYLGS
ncbi:MAG: HAD hydrolase family protein [Gammaproteobacteria bacterium]|nr:HAD hydrolase family protein [Gammaproteobacteria bacterium]